MSFMSSFFDNFLPFPNILKKGILVLFGAKVGSNVVIKPKVKIKYPWHLKIKQFLDW